MESIEFSVSSRYCEAEAWNERVKTHIDAFTFTEILWYVQITKKISQCKMSEDIFLNVQDVRGK